MRLSRFLPIILLCLTILLFFYPFFYRGKLPVPSDTIIGLYYPFRDLYAKDYPRGIPFKNSLITDPVRQQYPWKFLAIGLEKGFRLPLWNPYSMAGTPLLANLQSSPFYPFNILLFLPNFKIWWSVMIILQPLLAGWFMYLYLREIKLTNYSCFLGAFTYAFCGFSIAWLEWGTIGHVALWLPLILLSIDKIVINSKFKVSGIKDKRFLAWNIIFLFSLTSSFFAGHLQTFFYLFLVSFLYFFTRWWQFGRQKKIFILFLILYSCFLILTFFQWIPTMRFILESARSIDQISGQKEGWFLPTQHLIQFFAPDFFGNPATLNYFGVWNYGEFIGYVGIIPLVMACFALFHRYDKKTLFFGSVFFLSLIFALPSWFAKIPFVLQIPFLSTAQPTRLLFLTDFSLSLLAALGFDLFLQGQQKKKIIYPLFFIFLIYLSLWFFVLAGPQMHAQISAQNINIAKNNLYFPSLIFGISALSILLFSFIKIKKAKKVLIIILIVITIIDLFRFSYKFTPFTESKYLFPSTAGLEFIQRQPGDFRIMTTDTRILPPNFSVMYKLQSIDGYDPLYLKRYGELISAMERNEPNIKSPFGFDRIITPHNYSSQITDLLGVKYVLSLSDINSPKLKKVFSEGQTQIYENTQTFPRTFFVKNIIVSNNSQESVEDMFSKNINLQNTAIVQNWSKEKGTSFSKDKASIENYTENNITISTQNQKDGFLVLTDSFYPTWHALVCSTAGTNCRETRIYLTDFNFRGIIVPPGEHKIIFYDTLL